MWKLSEKTLELVRQLNELARTDSWIWWGRSKNAETTCTVLSELAAGNEPASVPYIARFLFSSTPSVRIAARRAISALMDCASPFDLLHVSDAITSAYGWYANDHWYRLVPNDVAASAAETGEAVNSAVLGLASFHRNGFVRHEAVRLLATINDGSELPFLLIRQNDWVRQVANDAQTAVAQRVTDVYLPHLVKSLRLIFHLAEFSRYDHKRIIHSAVEILLRDAHNDILKSVVNSSDKIIRREIVRLGIAIGGNHRSRLILFALKSDDPIVRLVGCRNLNHVGDSVVLADLLGRLEEDLSMSVRREALRIHADRFPSEANDTWRRALIDPSSSIRELARFYLAKLGDFDAASFYRQAILEKPDLLPVVEGLAESGDLSDTPIFRKYLTHDLPSRRCAAIRGLARVGGESAVIDLIHSLFDDSPSVVREARKWLEPLRQYLRGDNLLSVALEARYPFARRTAIILIAEMGKWTSLPWLIKAACAENGDIANFAEQTIEGWFSLPKCNQVFTKPNSDEFTAILEALATSKDHLSQQVADILVRELAKLTT